VIKIAHAGCTRSTMLSELMAAVALVVSTSTVRYMCSIWFTINLLDQRCGHMPRRAQLSIRFWRATFLCYWSVRRNRKKRSNSLQHRKAKMVQVSSRKWGTVPLRPLRERCTPLRLFRLEHAMKDVRLISKHGQPYGIRDWTGFLFFFTEVQKYDGQEDRYRRELAERWQLADDLMGFLLSRANNEAAQQPTTSQGTPPEQRAASIG
jgi:hypothetical protein